jgi:hypothetical protein
MRRKYRVALTQTEVLTALVLVSDLDPATYTRAGTRSLIEKCKDIREQAAADPDGTLAITLVRDLD